MVQQYKSLKRVVSIYDINSPFQKKIILIIGSAIAMLTPFTDTIYLPAMPIISQYYNAPDASVAASMSSYLGCVGIGQIIWGPLSDRYGRLPILYISFIGYVAFTIGCIFAATIYQLIILRSIEGLFIASTIVSVQAIISDAFAEKERGAAMGYFLVQSYFI